MLGAAPTVVEACVVLAAAVDDGRLDGLSRPPGGANADCKDDADVSAEPGADADTGFDDVATGAAAAAVPVDDAPVAPGRAGAEGDAGGGAAPTAVAVVA